MQVFDGKSGEVFDDHEKTSKQVSRTRQSGSEHATHGAYEGGKKTKSLAMRVEPELYDAFQAAVRERREPSMTRVIEDYMVWYVNNPPRE